MNAKLIRKMHSLSSWKTLVDIAMYFREGKRKPNIHHSKCRLAFESKSTRTTRRKPSRIEQLFKLYWGKGSKTFLT